MGHRAQLGEPDLVGEAAGGVVRGFAAHLKTVEKDTEIPPKGLLPGRASRMTPYLFSPAQITELMAAARALAHPLRAASFEALIGLMAVTGCAPVR